MEFEEGVIRKGCTLRQITPSEISIIYSSYDTKAEFNNIIVLLFIQNNS